jgi:hypothetical protein
MNDNQQFIQFLGCLAIVPLLFEIAIIFLGYTRH